MLARNRKIGKGRPVSAGYYELFRRSSTSRWRIGSLSIDRVSSRTVQGSGLRSSTVPSFATSTSMKPRGRSFSRIGIGQDHHVAFGQHFQPVLQDVHLLGK